MMKKNRIIFTANVSGLRGAEVSDTLNEVYKTIAKADVLDKKSTDFKTINEGLLFKKGYKQTSLGVFFFNELKRGCYYATGSCDGMQVRYCCRPTDKNTLYRTGFYMDFDGVTKTQYDEVVNLTKSFAKQRGSVF